MLRYVVLAAIALSLLAALGDPSVAVKPDEPLYGVIAQDMWRRHDAVIPMLDGQPAFYKPPLLYWMGMLAMTMLGPSTLALRLTTVLCGVLLLWAAFRLADRLYGRDSAWLAVALLGTSLGFFEYARAFMMDLPLATLYALACERWWVAVHDKNWKAAATAMSLLGLAVLLKGPVVIVIFGLGAAVFHLAWKRPVPWPGLIPGAVIALAIVAVWPAMVYQRGLGTTWYHDFILRENFGKFSERYDSGLVLWASALEQMLPWTFIAIGGLIVLYKERLYRDAAYAWPLLMAAAVLVVYLLPQRKLPHYVLPAVPLLLISTAGLLSKTGRLSWRITGTCMAALGLLLLAALRLATSLECQVGLCLAAAGALGVAWSTMRRSDAWALPAALFWSGMALAQSHLTTNLDVAQLRQAVSPGAVRSGMEIGMAAVDVNVPVPLIPVEGSRKALDAGLRIVIRRKDAAFAPWRQEQVRYDWWRWRDGLGLGDVLRAVTTGNTQPLQEEVVVVAP